MPKANNQSKQRVRRPFYCQLATIKWAAERFIQCKRGQNDFADLPKEAQELFLRLPTILKLCKHYYREFLYDRAERLDRTKGINAARLSLPDCLREEVDVVLEYLRESKVSKSK